MSEVIPPALPTMPDSTPAAAMSAASGRIVYLTSLTKAASPSLRVGAVIARGPIARRLHALRAVDDMFVSRPLQETTLELVSRPMWQHHLKGLSRALGRRAETLFHAV